jgi:hypothetical protein
VRPLEYNEQVARCLLPGAHEQLQLWQGQPHGAGPAVSAALQASGDAQAEASSQQVDTSGFDAAHATDCDGCGQAAVGLRRCARCKKAQYCRLGQRCCLHPTHSLPSAWLALASPASRVCLPGYQRDALFAPPTHALPLVQPGVPGGALACPQARVQPRLMRRLRSSRQAQPPSAAKRLSNPPLAAEGRRLDSAPPSGHCAGDLGSPPTMLRCFLCFFCVGYCIVSPLLRPASLPARKATSWFEPADGNGATGLPRQFWHSLAGLCQCGQNTIPKCPL